MDDLRSRILLLIVSRFILLTVLLETVLSTVSATDLMAQYRHGYVLGIALLSCGYFLWWSWGSRLSLLYSFQFYFDFLLFSHLVYLSGGIVSLLSPFYVLIIVYASLFRQREGGILALALTVVSYVGTVHISYLWPAHPVLAVDSYWEVLQRLSLNIVAFSAVALLGILLSQRLHATREELGAARELHDNILKSLRSGLLTLDLGGHITSINHVAEEICGVSGRNLVGEPLARIFPPGIQERVLESDLDPSQRPERLEFWTLGGQQQPVFLGMSCSPLISQDKAKIGYLISFQDLTEIKNREEQLRLKEKMAAIGQLSADMAHEIRNPLGALYGSIQILQAELDLSADNARLVEIILRECERLNKILGDFLTYAGPRPSRLESVDLATLLRETTELFQNNPDCQKHHPIRLEIDSDSVHCYADSHQIRQVIWNILQNAVRAMPNGGTTAIQLQRTDSRIWLNIEDEGIGMDENQLKKLFQPFNRGFRQGSGLGMAIVYQIVQQHNGGIEVQSRLGKGTKISVWLPTSKYKFRTPADQGVLTVR